MKDLVKVVVGLIITRGFVKILIMMRMVMLVVMMKMVMLVIMMKMVMMRMCGINTNRQNPK